MSRKFWLFTVFCLLVSLPVLASGQDLGSSNSLFGGKKPKSSTPAAKTPAKGKTTAPKTAKAPPKTTKTKTSSASAKATGKSTSGTTAKQPTKAKRFSAKTSEPTPPSNPATDELFETLIDEGNLARDERRYSAAESAYQKAKKLKPKDSRAIYGLGNLYSDQQRWDDAESAYRAALQIEPDNSIANIALSFVLSQPLMVSNLSDRYAEADKLARHAIEIAPSNALAFDQLGVSLERLGLISDETENAYRKAIKLDPTFAPAYAHLGRLLRLRGQTKESAAAYENAIQRATDVPTMIIVAEVMQSEQRYAESETLLRKAVATDPKNPAGLLLLGKALTTQGNYVDAEKFLRKSLDVSSNGFMPNCLLGSLYARQGKYELAENALLQALRFVSASEKRNLSLQFEMVGDGYMKGGNSASAQRVYKQAVALDAERESLADKLARSQHT